MPEKEPQLNIENAIEKITESAIAEIKNYFEHDFIQDDDDRAAKEFFAGLNRQEFEKIFSKEAIRLFGNVLHERKVLIKLMEEKNLQKDSLGKLYESNSGMLPYRIRETLSVLSSARLEIKEFFKLQYYYYESSENKDMLMGLSEDHVIGTLKEHYGNLNREYWHWLQGRSIEIRKSQERPPIIDGFEKFDTAKIRGSEIIEKAAAILPEGLSFWNIGRIAYKDEIEPIGEKYGFSGQAIAFYQAFEGPNRAIVFHKVSNLEGPDYCRNMPVVLAHEFWHSLDPRIGDQIDLTMGEQMQMLQEWEDARNSEQEWSSYVLKIKNEDKERETATKSTESLAESGASFLEDPENFTFRFPVRAAFFAKWMEKRFPDFNFSDREENKKRLRKMYSFLPQLYE